MKKITLSQGKFALVDDADFDWLNQWKWCFHWRGYAVRSQKVNGKVIGIQMHRLIAGTPQGMDTDHRDGDGINNQRVNLRTATRTQNNQNKASIHGSSRFKGVCRYKRDGNWKAYICINKKRTHLGYFSSECDAAQAYNFAAIEAFGVFARLNLAHG